MIVTAVLAAALAVCGWYIYTEEQAKSLLTSSSSHNKHHGRHHHHESGNTSPCAAGCDSTTFPGRNHKYNPINRNGNTCTKVQRLPGWTGPLKSPMYSGYVNVTSLKRWSNITDMSMNYNVYEAEENEGLDSTPIILWVSGGPGAAGTGALFTSNGPYLLNEMSVGTPRFLQTKVPQILYNEYNWAKLGTLITFAPPPPVGFSRCSPSFGEHKLYECGAYSSPWNDTTAGQVQIEGLRILMEDVIPDLMINTKRPLYIIGESYAGVYISEMANFLVNDAKYSKIRKHFAGAALGNACLGTEQICPYTDVHNTWDPFPGPWWWLQFQYGHGQLTTAMWEEITSKCPRHGLEWNLLSKECEALCLRAKAKVGNFYIYNEYDNCADLKATTVPTSSSEYPDTFQGNYGADRGPYTRQGYPCPGSVFDSWIQRDDVHDALGIARGEIFGADDGHEVGWYQNPPTLKDAFPIWPKLLKATGDMLFTPRLMPYEGTTDTAINLLIYERKWLQEFPKNFSSEGDWTVTKSWYPWLMNKGDNRTAGHFVRHANDQLVFATIKGSGHQVPEYYPVAAFSLFKHWIANDLDGLPDGTTDQNP